MAVFSKHLLSGSTNGRPIQVEATASPGTLVHTATSETDDFDEVWLYAVNTHSAALDLTVQFGGTTSADQIVVAVPSQAGLYVVIPGLPLNNALVVRAFCETTDLVNVTGFVNRITAS